MKQPINTKTLADYLCENAELQLDELLTLNDKLQNIKQDDILFFKNKEDMLFYWLSDEKTDTYEAYKNEPFDELLEQHDNIFPLKNGGFVCWYLPNIF